MDRLVDMVSIGDSVLLKIELITEAKVELSTDQGMTWTEVCGRGPWMGKFASVDGAIYSMVCGREVFVFGARPSGGICGFSSTDQGKTWSELPGLCLPGELKEFAMCSDHECSMFIAGGAIGTNASRVVWRSNDRGRSWRPVCVDAPFGISTGAKMCSTQEGWLVLIGRSDASPDTWVSRDHGARWQKVGGVLPVRNKDVPFAIAPRIGGGIWVFGQPSFDASVRRLRLHREFCMFETRDFSEYVCTQEYIPLTRSSREINDVHLYQTPSFTFLISGRQIFRRNINAEWHALPLCPSHIAALSGDVTQYPLETDVLGMNQIHKAAIYDQPSVIDAYVRYGVDIWGKDRSDRTALFLAASFGSGASVRSLLATRPSSSIVSMPIGKLKLTALHMAVSIGSLEIIDMLLTAGADVNARAAMPTTGPMCTYVAAGERITEANVTPLQICIASAELCDKDCEVDLVGIYRVLRAAGGIADFPLHRAAAAVMCNDKSHIQYAMLREILRDEAARIDHPNAVKECAVAYCLEYTAAIDEFSAAGANFAAYRIGSDSIVAHATRRRLFDSAKHLILRGALGDSASTFTFSTDEIDQIAAFRPENTQDAVDAISRLSSNPNNLSICILAGRRAQALHPPTFELLKTKVPAIFV